MEAIVVGGGIIGLSSAYYLHQGGVDVTVCEKSSIGAGSTGRANGGIRAQFSSPISAALSKESITVWERFEDEFGTDIGYRRPGYLFLAREKSTAERFRENVRKQNEVGVESRFLTPEEAEKHCPEIQASRFVGATYCPTDGFADPHLSLQGFSRAASEAGVSIQTNVEVIDVCQNDVDRVTGVETTEGRLQADFVVNAAGPWAGEVAEMAGMDLPIVPKRRQLMIVNPESPIDDTVPFTVDTDGGVHFRPERGGNAVVGGHFDDHDPRVDPDRVKEKMDLPWALNTLEEASKCANYFGPASEIIRGWAGLYAVTPDHHPIIEESKSGFINAVGFSGHGYMQAPATGQLVAELVADGKASLVDISALTSDRFDREDHLEEGTVID